MNETEYKRLRRQIDEDYGRNIDALERVWRLSNPSADLPLLAGMAEVPKSRQPRGEIEGAVIKELQTFSGPFTWKMVHDRLMVVDPAAQPNRTTVSQVLRKLLETKEIHEIEKGRGKRPAVYVIAPRVSADPETLSRIRELAKLCGFEVDDFKSRFMEGYQKLADMPKHLVDEILSELQRMYGTEEVTVPSE